MSVTDWIRPWYPGATGVHISADCPTLARETDTPAEGSGWLNPAGADGRCPDCFTWNATCQCGAYSLWEQDDGPHDKATAEKWAREHFCIPSIAYTVMPRHQPEPEPVPAGQLALFNLKDVA